MSEECYNKLLTAAKEKYDFIFIDTSSNIFLDSTKWSLQESNRVLFETGGYELVKTSEKEKAELLLSLGLNLNLAPVADVSIDGKSILINENQIDTSIPSKEFSFDFNNNDKTQEEILVELKSPLRFKTNGKYTLDFSASGFMKCLYRRVKTLCMLYGTWEDEFNHYEFTEGISIEDKKLRWLDLNHYSARQKKGMELGGVIGSFKLSGEFSSFELALFELNRIANAGKNTNFGLGQIDFWKR